MSSYLVKEEITERVLEIISSANNYIKVGCLMFNYVKVVTALIEAADRGVAIFVLTNPRDTKKRPNYQKESEPEDLGTADFNIAAHQEHLEKMGLHGVHTRYLVDLHAKFILADGTQGILMSSNFNVNSMERNLESGISLDQNERVYLEHVFDTLYVNADIESMTTHGNLKIRNTQIHKIGNEAFAENNSRIRCTIAGQESNLKYCMVNDLYHTIVDAINESERYCWIVSYHFMNLQRLPDFCIAVKNARKRHVRLIAYCRNKDGNQANQRQLGLLNKLGCSQQYGDADNHSKCIITDKTGIIFTANIDGDHGMLTGFEVGCIMTEQQRKDALAFMNNLIK